ncbi:hypothetical protein [Piscinibacter terrae]|uniref:Phosphoglycerate mutase n=1 Tax=Piscinibacter terrae TaxID=2496871 RepID=A0A3N7HS35_9BURK|nr:hypothetical protein [Albitalea terrae]RQP25004.1 hypothetical protein DZC73_09105 [Albitalea terrae]
MQLLIPFAAALSDAGIHTARDLALPHLARALAAAQPGDALGSDEYSLTPPHERALAQARGWQGDDGALPFAAHAAAADGIEAGTRAWGLLTPVHWHVGRDHISLADPADLNLGDEESRTVFEAVRPLFETEGFELVYATSTRWYAAHEDFDRLPCASIDRVIGRNVDLWLPTHPEARLVRRLQNEVQMLLYNHAVNDEREARGEPTVNSFWLSGCGRRQPVAGNEPTVSDALRAPQLAEDWASWADAWRALDAGPVRQWLERAPSEPGSALVLCGERFARRFEMQPRSAWQRLTAGFRSVQPHTILETL